MNETDVLADESAVEQAKEFLTQGDTIEFYELIAGRLLKHQPVDPVLYCLELVDLLRQGQTPDINAPMTHASPVSSRTDQPKYMKTYKISDFLDKWILAFVADKAGAGQNGAAARAARLAFHHQYLSKLAESKQ